MASDGDGPAVTPESTVAGTPTELEAITGDAAPMLHGRGTATEPEIFARVDYTATDVHASRPAP